MKAPEVQPRILIAGAGIGGLTTALALKRLGFRDIQVIEQTAVLKEVGAGIQLGPNAVKVLHRLGLADTLAQVAVAPLATKSRNWSNGRTIRNFPLGQACAERYGAPYYHVHRADLHTALLDAYGRADVRLGARVASHEQDARGVRLNLETGEQIEGDVLVGADGVHSVIRGQLLEGHDPGFTGLLAWRGMADAAKASHLGIEKNVNAWWGPHRHFVNYYVSAGKRINWIGIVPAGQWRLESWSARGDKAELLKEFDGWHPIVRGLIEATDEVFKWALYDRDPWPVWTQGRVTLLGDAAHPMVPFMSQGGAQSIEDGCVLALCLAGLPHDPAAALAAYQDLRTERTARVQLGSREAGRMFHQTDPWKKFVRDMKFRWATLTDSQEKWRRVDWLYGYDCEAEVEAKLGKDTRLAA
ncbi:6-hydroxynicotinate 3-monooxygenase precursor [Pigmentiphaga humi]|uniref:6-hydroxynicotinate 3-monooxygenase n=1 Tax=Pigmentiphaga humi TaxID=2478468 RepID=A0A3P4B043_9BURK|nr:FAD-dependent monooxygenase [Pigmentiphaga humi]VCU68475.1 6-hydroxynicotinate 3-monooxygenase precursor [Pigmentiphaga humi]